MGQTSRLNMHMGKILAVKHVIVFIRRYFSRPAGERQPHNICYSYCPRGGQLTGILSEQCKFQLLQEYIIYAPGSTGACPPTAGLILCMPHLEYIVPNIMLQYLTATQRRGGNWCRTQYKSFLELTPKSPLITAFEVVLQYYMYERIPRVQNVPHLNKRTPIWRQLQAPAVARRSSAAFNPFPEHIIPPLIGMFL